MRILLCIALLLATAAGAAAAVARHHQPARTGQLELLAKAGKTVTVTAVPASGLYPGASKPLVVTVRNLNAFTVKVAAVTGTVAAKTSAAGCAGSFLTVVAPKKALTIKSTKSAKATLAVTLKSSAPDACQGAKFTLKLSAKAVKS